MFRILFKYIGLLFKTLNNLQASMKCVMMMWVPFWWRL